MRARLVGEDQVPKLPFQLYAENRRESAKQAILSALSSIEDGVRKARRALENDEEVFTSFLQVVPSLVEAAAKHAVYSETLKMGSK